MKIKFSKNDLNYATRVVYSLVPPQTSLPILGNILMRARDDDVSFFACDMESAVQCTIKAEVQEEGEITVPATPFATLVRELPEVDILIWLDEDENVHVEADRNEYKLQPMSPADFPVWSDFKPLCSFEVEQKSLRRMIDKTLFAIPLKDPRKVLLGAYLNVNKDIPETLDAGETKKPAHLRLVATDGKKLGYIDVLGSNLQGSGEIGVIIPQKVLSEIQKILGEEGMVTVGVGEKQVFFRFGNIEFKSNKIEGDFPNYEMVIPNDFEHNIPLEKVPFLNAIKRAAIISESQNNSIIFHFRSGEVELSAQTFDLGSFQGSFPVEYEGDEFEIAFNHKYLIEVLHVMDTENVTMHIKAANQPIIFHEKDRPETLYLVMPIKLSELQTQPETPEEEEEEGE